MLERFTPQQSYLIKYLLPALVGGGVAWLTFVTIGQTPLIRASGLALVIVGVTLTLRRLGALFAISGGLALAYCPAFWSQTGGGQSPGVATIVVALVAAVISLALFTWLVKRPYLGLAFGLIIFALIFWSQIGTPRSLRLTGLLTAWLLYGLVDTLLLTNPRPDDPASNRQIDSRQTLGLLVVLALGVLNDPLFTLLAPAALLALILSKTRLSWWYWAAFAIIVIVGVRGIIVQYGNDYWWLFSAAEAHNTDIRVPYIIAGGWREPARWQGLFELVISQFSIVGIALGILGLARLSRWYPALGSITMVAYAAYTVFGLVYFGQDRTVLLLPLLIIQVIWMTYAVYTFGQWLQKSLIARQKLVSWLAPAVFAIMPLLMLFRIVGIA